MFTRVSFGNIFVLATTGPPCLVCDASRFRSGSVQWRGRWSHVHRGPISLVEFGIVRLNHIDKVGKAFLFRDWYRMKMLHYDLQE